MWLLLVKLWSNPLVRKFTVYAVVILAALYCLRLYGNAQWKKGEQKGRQNSVQVLEKAKKEEWKKVEATLKERDSSLANAQAALASAQNNNAELTRQLARSRTELNTTLKNGLAAIHTELGHDYGEVNNIPASELNSAFRTIVNELSTTK